MVSELEIEKNRLEENLQIIAAPRNHIRDIRARNTMSAILDRNLYYERMIENEKDKIKDLDLSINVLEKQLRDLRLKIPSTKILETERDICKVANVALENRIQQATVRLNSILAENTVLRQDIENQLKSRDKFILQAKKLENNLSSTTKKKSNMMDEVIKAYTERDEAQTKMKSLRERIDRDNLKYSKEMKKIQRAIDYQANLRAFVNTIAAGEDDDFSRRKEGEELNEKGLEATMENYRLSISHLEESSQETSMDTLISNYLQAENDNYTVFSYISDLNNEITAVTNDVRKLQQEIDSVLGKGKVQIFTTEDNAVLGNLKEELMSLRKDITDLENDVKEAEDMLEEVKQATIDIFQAVNCNPKPVEAIIGGTEVTSTNLCMFLSVIEQRVKELARMRELFMQEGVAPSRMGQTSTDLGNESESESAPLSVKIKPTIPHMGHANEEEIVGPTTHNDFLSTIKTNVPDNSNE